jgi:hypothetical protein
LQHESSCLFAFVDNLLEFVSGGEFRYSAGSNLNSGSGLRVPTIAGLALRNAKGSESDQGDSVPPSEGSSYAIDDSIDRGGGPRFRDFAGYGDPVNEVSFIHDSCLLLRLVFCSFDARADEQELQDVSNGEAHSPCW